ncbi:MAG: MBL fold metallo-hydrolase [Acidimicrobiia bacterium]|nr:MBL fold metallo-hydrolase [Acidimicrobiia bacterium]
MTQSRRVGTINVTALLDGEGPFFENRGDVFPAATADQWRAADAFDPGAHDEAGRWHLHFRCFAIRYPRIGTVLVDAGIGPAESPLSSWTPVPGVLPQSLDEAGIAPDEIETVVLTHLHRDHTGWAVSGRDDVKPYFPNARYVLQSTEADWLQDSLLHEQVLAPLDHAQQLSLIDGEEKLSTEIKVVPTPGHTRGHQSVIVEGREETLVVTGDLLVHSIQLLYPEVGYLFEDDQEAAYRSRERIMDLVSSTGGILGTAHLSEPFV